MWSQPVVTARASGRTAGAPASRSWLAAMVMVQPVSMRSSTSRSGPVSWLSASRRSSGTVSARPQRAQPLGAIVAARAGAVGAGVAERAEVGQPADLRDPLAEARNQDGPGARRHGDHAGRALAPVPGGQDFDHGVGELVGDRPVGSLVGEQRPQCGSPADVGETAERAARLGLRLRGSCPRRRGFPGPSSPAATSAAARPRRRGGAAAAGLRPRRPAGLEGPAPGRCSCRSGRSEPPAGRRARGAGTPRQASVA